MSVAFRRESDEEHLEPKFELPIPPGRNLVTPRGLRLIEERVAALETALAGADGEPAERHARDLRYWRTRRATAEVMPPAAGEEVAFGARVRFRLNGAARTVEIVGYDEADAAADRISFTAPLARALMGAVAGEAVDFGGRAEAIVVEAVLPA